MRRKTQQPSGQKKPDRRQSGERLLPSSLYQTLFESAPVGLGIADMQGNLIAFNDAMLKPGGYSREDITKISNVSAFYYDLKDREKALEIFRRQGFLHQHLVQFKRKDGTPYSALLSLRTATYAGQPCLQAMVEDVDQRKKLENALAASEARYRNLFQYAPIALCEMDLSSLKKFMRHLGKKVGDLRIYLKNNPAAVRECLARIKFLDMNKNMLTLFKAGTKEEIIANRADVFQLETYDSFADTIVELAQGKRSSAHESVARTFAGDTIHIFVSWFVSIGSEETLSSVILSIIDLTALKSMALELMQTEEQLGTLIETMNEGFGIQDRNGMITYANEKLSRMLGYSRTELVGRHIDELLDGPNRKILKKQIAERKKGLNRPYDLEWLKKNGGKVYTVVSPMPIYDASGQYSGSSATLTDITERKEYEELILSYQKQLSLLSSRLFLVEENERHKIAENLHENIGQILACAQIKLGELMESPAAGSRDEISRIRGLIEQCIAYTRSLTFRLSVPILFEFGLGPAVEWLGQEYQKLYSIQVRVGDDGKSKPLTNDMRITMFRAIRELLTNVVKHAHASHVTVSLERKAHSIRAIVRDDGTGFDVKNIYGESAIKNCFGLFSISESLKNCGGTIKTDSAPGSGTKITLTAPLAEE